MTVADPIRAALKAAAKALPVCLYPSAEDIASTYIVAFLRALPEDSLRLPGDAGLLLGYLPRALADAVEKCASDRSGA